MLNFEVIFFKNAGTARIQFDQIISLVLQAKGTFLWLTLGNSRFGESLKAIHNHYYRVYLKSNIFNLI